MLKYSTLSEKEHDPDRETEWGCGVAANMRPCQGRDRGFEPRHSRTGERFQERSFFFIFSQTNRNGTGQFHHFERRVEEPVFFVKRLFRKGNRCGCF